MPENNSTPEVRENINERIRMSVRERLQPQAISIDVSQELADLCARWGTTPEGLIKGFIIDVTRDTSAPYDPYPVFFNQAAQNYLSVAHGSTRIIKGGKYTERPARRAFN